MAPPNWHRKLIANHTFLYAMNIVHFFAGLLPEPLRSTFFGLFLGKKGRGVYIDNRVYFKFPRRVFIGDYVSINRGCEFYPSHFGNSAITIGSDVRIGPHVHFFGAGHNVDKPTFDDLGGDIVVGNGCWIGGNTTILAGVTIGDGAVVAAGSVVVADVAPQSVVAGVPAKFVRMRDLK